MRGLRRHAGAELPLERADFLGGLRKLRAETSRLPDLKLVAKAGERDGIRNSGMGLQGIREDHPPFPVDLQDFAGAVERRRKLLALLRVRRILRYQALDLLEQRIAACVQRWAIEGWVTIKSLETVAAQHRAERGRNGHAALGIEP